MPVDRVGGRAPPVAGQDVGDQDRNPPRAGHFGAILIPDQPHENRPPAMRRPALQPPAQGGAVRHHQAQVVLAAAGDELAPAARERPVEQAVRIAGREREDFHPLQGVEQDEIADGAAAIDDREALFEAEIERFNAAEADVMGRNIEFHVLGAPWHNGWIGHAGAMAFANARPNPAAEDAALQQALMKVPDDNVHSTRHLHAFNQQLAALDAHLPGLPSSTALPGSRPILRLELAVRDAIADFAERHPGQMQPSFGTVQVNELAEAGATAMCHGHDGNSRRDFPDYSPQATLGLAWHFVQQQPEAERGKGVEAILFGLAAAQGNNPDGKCCMTRHVEEVLLRLQRTYPNSPVMLPSKPYDQARDTMVDVSKPILHAVLDGPFAQQGEQAMQQAYERNLWHTLREHKDIAPDQVRRFLREYAFPNWDAMKDLAQA